MSDRGTKPRNPLIFGLLIGAAIGTAIGVALDNIATVAIGSASAWPWEQVSTGGVTGNRPLAQPEQ